MGSVSIGRFIFFSGGMGEGVETKSQLDGSRKYSQCATNYANVAARAVDALRPGGVCGGHPSR